MGEGHISIKRSRERQPERIEFARSQRQQANEFSYDVWQMVRAGRILREKFKREYPLGPYTLDFVCIDLQLNIEVDGIDHMKEEGRKHDADRDAYLRGLGYTVLRLKGFRITQDPLSARNEIESTVRQLRDQSQESPSPPPPLPEAGRGGKKNQSAPLAPEVRRSIT